MAFRTPPLTIVFLVLTVACYVGALWYDNWMKYDLFVKADVGILQYKVTEAEFVSTGTSWTFDIDCDKGLPDSHDRKDCKTWKSVSIALLVLVFVAVLSILNGLVDCICGSATQIRPFFAAFIFSITSTILFLAAYQRVRIPYTNTHYLSRTASTLSSDLLTASIDNQFHLSTNSTPADESSPTPSLTFGPAFFIFVAGNVFNIAGLFYHMCTCTKRKHEEL